MELCVRRLFRLDEPHVEGVRSRVELLRRRLDEGLELWQSLPQTLHCRTHRRCARTRLLGRRGERGGGGGIRSSQLLALGARLRELRRRLPCFFLERLHAIQ